MTTINDIDDFLRILREDEMVRSAVRRELLSEELLELPQRIASLTKSIEEYRESTEQRFDMVVSRLDRQDEMYRQQKESTEQRFDMVVSRLDEQKESTDQRFDMVVSRLDRQHEMYRRQHDDLGRFRGNYAMYAARKNRYEIARLFALPRFIRRIECNLLDSDVLNKMLNDNYESLDTLGLSEETLDSFPMADMVIEVNDRRISRLGFYVAVEASFTADNGDVTRAVERARILRCATGLDAYAVVAGVRLAPNIENLVFDDAEGFMESDDENSAFWYPIVDRDLEPLDPS